MATRKPLLVALLLLAALVAAACAFVWFGVYNVGADDPHTRPMLMLMQTLRGRSIQVRAANLQVPDLEDPQLILKGAGQYAAMCTGCHLAPGLEDSEIRPGLYPQPPNLAREPVDPKVAFWVIKHGVKMSAMPAWGLTHDDPTIWSMVAFLQKLPTLTPTQYQQIVAEAPADEDMDGGGHHHGEGAAMPGMPMMVGAGGAATHEHGGPAGHDHDETAHQPETTRSIHGLEHGDEPRSDRPSARP